MMKYYDLSIPLSSTIQLFLFVGFCASFCILGMLAKRKSVASKVITILCMLVSGTALVIYTGEARSRLRNLELPAISDWLCNQSVLIPIVIIVFVAVACACLYKKEVEYRHTTITRASIQEGVDKISTGLCFYNDIGRVILSNQKMQELCFAIVGRDLQNAALFWQILREGEVLPDVKRLSSGEKPTFRLSDGTAWSFAFEKLEGVNQLTAANTTQIQNVTDQLRAKNADLYALNLRLRQYGENVDELTRSRERLETKARIHGELGHALLSTRRFLLDEENKYAPPLNLWEQNVAMLRKEAEYKTDEQPLEMLARIASTTGIDVHIEGELSDDIYVQRLFVQAAAEALTNAISHADAKNLFVKVSEDRYNYYAHITNDGNQPKAEIVEGGGLTSLRKKIENEAGVMKITSLPEFSLDVELPKERGDFSVTGFARRR